MKDDSSGGEQDGLLGAPARVEVTPEKEPENVGPLWSSSSSTRFLQRDEPAGGLWEKDNRNARLGSFQVGITTMFAGELSDICSFPFELPQLWFMLGNVTFV